MIAWKYINKNAAAIAALRDYDSMRVIINNTPDSIKELYTRLTSPRGPNLSGMPTAHNVYASQDSIAAQVDKLDLLQERYSTAIEYLKWFEPAWVTLSDTEQHILREFYMTGNRKSGATYRLMHELGYSERTIDRMRSNALNHIRLLLIG